MHVVGLVLHPERDCGGAVSAVLDWADRRGIRVLGIDTELDRLVCTAEPVTVEEMRQQADLIVSMGGDGTMLRAMRLADRQRFPVLGVNLGKLGFLAEVDVPDLADALSAIDRFVSYSADAVVVATPTGSTAYSFSAGGPIVSPGVEALLVTPVAPHSAYNRGLVVACNEQLALDILPTSGRLAVEADGNVAANVAPGDQIELRPRPGAARVVRLGRTTFYERARRKLRLTDSAELPDSAEPPLSYQP
jgi:NAD+ kinase